MLTLLTWTPPCRADSANTPFPFWRSVRARDDPRNVTRAGELCKTLGLKVIDDPATRHVAEKIIELSQHGVRGVATLHAMTVKEFQDDRAPCPYRGPRFPRGSAVVES